MCYLRDFELCLFLMQPVFFLIGFDDTCQIIRDIKNEDLLNNKGKFKVRDNQVKSRLVRLLVVQGMFNLYLLDIFSDNRLKQ